MIKVLLCRDCKWSVREREDSEYFIQCTHPVVNRNDHYMLGRGVVSGTSCTEERKLKWYSFPDCGMRGKLWEIRLDSDPKL